MLYSRQFFLIGVVVLALVTGTVELSGHICHSAVVNITDYHCMAVTTSHTPSGSILIQSNEDFETQGFPGSGTQEEPYVISGLIIDANGSEWSCISVHDTTVYFIIEDCILLWSGVNCRTPGVFFGNVTYGTVRNCTAYSKIRGFWIEGSSFCAVEDCITYNNTWDGVRLSNSDNCTVSNTIAFNNGNEAGYYIYDSKDCLLFNDTAYMNNAGYLVIGSNITMSNCTAYDNDSHGFWIAGNDSTIKYGLAFDNKYSGIYVEAKGVDVIGNRVYCDKTLISGNAEIQLSFQAMSCNVYYNRIGPTVSGDLALDDGTGNDWDDGVSLGNYWSDWDSSSFYPISGSAGSVDDYPQDLGITPNIDHPSDMDYEVGTVGHNITWNPSGLCLDRYEVFRNETMVDSGDMVGIPITVSVDGLNPGAYEYRINVYDTSDNKATDVVIVNVVSETSITSMTTTTTTPTTSTLSVQMGLIIVGAGAILIIIVVVLVLKKRS